MGSNTQQIDTSSKFHWLFMPGQTPRTALYDKIVVETHNFIVLPSRGSIVPGWLLVVPKFPISRIADVPTELHTELNDLVFRISKKLESKFGKTYVFEHGGVRGSVVSCGVDQAHLHITSLSFDLIQAAKLASPGSWESLGSNSLPHLDNSRSEYWFVASGDITMCKNIDRPCSQFFRKIIAREAGMETLWDYRSEDFLENVSSTLEALGTDGR